MHHHGLAALKRVVTLLQSENATVNEEAQKLLSFIVSESSFSDPQAIAASSFESLKEHIKVLNDVVNNNAIILLEMQQHKQQITEQIVTVLCDLMTQPVALRFGHK